MTAVSQSSDLEVFDRRLPLFDGFPYLVTRMAGPLCHVMLLPADRSEEELRRLVRLQVLANRLEACLVLDADRAIVFDTDGAPSRIAAAPRGGLPVAERLRPAEDFSPTPELLARAERLRLFVESFKQGGYLVGSPQSGYRPATTEEISRLSGHGADGVPPGLVCCGGCGEYRGECLGLAPHSAQSIARVYCRCENHNRCARCGNPLSDWRLRAHHFNRGDRKIWFTPGFCGMSHACSEDLRRVQ